ncbi:hypothetical protein G6F40_016749 [Rhizopus arrhizus]|nr:hypothetical protein G6F40_016749 [Rhizopus arrhizus]
MFADIKFLRNDAGSERCACHVQLLQTRRFSALQNQSLCSCCRILQRERAADATRCAGNEHAAGQTGLHAFSAVHGSTLFFGTRRHGLRRKPRASPKSRTRQYKGTNLPFKPGNPWISQPVQGKKGLRRP